MKKYLFKILFHEKTVFTQIFHKTVLHTVDTRKNEGVQRVQNDIAQQMKLKSDDVQRVQNDIAHRGNPIIERCAIVQWYIYTMHIAHAIMGCFEIL